MLSKEDINRIGKGLIELGLPYTFGYAGSYARDEATDSSDLDIVISGAMDIDIDNYMTICNYLQIYGIEFDIINLDSMEIEDKNFDKELVSKGYDENPESAYKTIKRDVIWFSGN